jgi:AmmeMemoRadiSam system protein A
MTEFPPEAGGVVTGLARAAILHGMNGPRPAVPDWLLRPGACFVTLRAGDESLRGCIGSLVACRPLAADIWSNALSAAFHDFRFAPLEPAEFEDVTIEVSVLSEPEVIEAASPAEAWAAVRPGVDGVILEADGHRATFLPQVWEELPELSVFRTQLERKAGLPPWPVADYRLSRYTVTAFAESD